MTIDWSSFTPWSALAGGALIGFAAVLLVLVNGRIAGISGIVHGLIWSPRKDADWKAAFVAGLVVAPLAYSAVAALPPISVEAGTPIVVVAGVLVGLGTRYATGCTSGHGVCGISRLSPRSFVATLLFMAAGFVTVFVVRHMLG